MLITKEFLCEKQACSGYEKWFEDNKMFDKPDIEVLGLLIKHNHLSEANWLIVRCMKYEQYVSYAVFAAESVLHIFEDKYPEDKLPRTATEAARKCIEDPSKENKAASYAAYASYASSYTYAADAAFYAAYAAYATSSYASSYASYAADAAAYAASYTAARKAMRVKILKYGIELLKKG